MVRQAQVDRRDPQGGDDQRGVGAGRHRRRQQGGRRRPGAAGTRRRSWSARPMSPRPSRSGTTIRACGRRKLRAGREGHPGPRLHLHGRDAQRGRSLARLPARPCLRQCPPAADLDAQPRPHDAALGGVGGAGTGRAFRWPAAALSRRTEGSTPFRFSLHVGDVGHTLVVGPTGAGKSRAAGADGAAVPPLSECADLRLRFRRLDPRRRARHGRRLARSRRRARRRATTGRSRCSRWPGSTMLGRARLGGRLARRDPRRARGVDDHAGGQGASLVGADLAGLRAGRANAR